MEAVTETVRSGGGIHPQGWVLHFYIFTQDNGLVRFEGLRDGYIAMSVYNLTLDDALKLIAPFMANPEVFD